jgi:hypothetical protein
MGALASGTAAAVGSGAFSSVTASRNVDVTVADDASAYLRLAGAGGANAEYVTGDGTGGTLTINLSSNNPTNAGGDGVNPDAITQIDDLFVIENQGTQDVDVSLSKTGANASLVSFYPEGQAYGGDSLASSPVTLSPGDSTLVSIEVDTEGSGVGDGDQLLDSVTISATSN